MAVIEGMLQELEHEAQVTRRVLERVPEHQFSWRPHPRARTLGQLALHIATVPGAVASLVVQPSPVQAPQFTEPDPEPASVAELLATLDDSIASARTLLGPLDDTALASTWRIVEGERELMALPRVAFIRAVVLNHWYHHRGQLTVYLRELDVPIPSIYGPSADDNPFA